MINYGISYISSSLGIFFGGFAGLCYILGDNGEISAGLGKTAGICLASFGATYTYYRAKEYNYKKYKE